MLIGLFVSITTVSFASDGPKTTKDCVVHVGDALASDVQVNDVKAASLEVPFVSSAIGSADTFNSVERISVVVFATNEYIDNRFVAQIDYGTFLSYRCSLVTELKKRIFTKNRFIPLLC